MKNIGVIWMIVDLDTDFTITYCLFRAVKLAKNVDPNK